MSLCTGCGGTGVSCNFTCDVARDNSTNPLYEHILHYIEKGREAEDLMKAIERAVLLGDTVTFCPSLNGWITCEVSSAKGSSGYIAGADNMTTIRRWLVPQYFKVD